MMREAECVGQPDWALARKRVQICPGSVNLNCGSFGLPWISAFEKAAEFREKLARQPMDFLLRELPGRLAESRTTLAGFLNHPSNRLFFSTNVTTAINQVAVSLARNPVPGAILVTDLEYGCLRWLWEKIACETGAELRVLKLPRKPAGPGEILEVFDRELRGAIRIAFFSHIISSTGMVLPVEEICGLANQRGILTIVDGAHGPGQVPLDLARIGATVYCANLHKWMCIPIGCGFVAFGDEVAGRLEPLCVSWGYSGYCNQLPHFKHGASLDGWDGFGSTPRLRRLEFVGTQDFSSWLSIPAALQEWSQIGGDNVFKRQGYLSGYARKKLEKVGLESWTPDQAKMSAAMTAWRMLPSLDLDRLRDFLFREHRIEVGLNRLPEGELLLRVSNHFFTQEGEIDLLASVLSMPVKELKSKVEAC